MKKMKSYAQIQHQLSNLQYDEIPLKRCEKRCFFARFSHVFRSALMGFRHIANWRVGGESAHKSSSFSYISLFDTINIQILNCVDSFLIC